MATISNVMGENIDNSFFHHDIILIISFHMLDKYA